MQLLIHGLSGSNAFAAKKSAWKNPSIEIDEDYWGTYHIEKNMTLEVPYYLIRRLLTTGCPAASEATSPYHDLYGRSKP